MYECYSKTEKAILRYKRFIVVNGCSLLWFPLFLFLGAVVHPPSPDVVILDIKQNVEGFVVIVLQGEGYLRHPLATFWHLPHHHQDKIIVTAEFLTRKLHLERQLGVVDDEF